MQISPISITPKINSKLITKPSMQNNDINENTYHYNPIFYRPQIAFKANLAEDNFPSELLGIKEQEFDELLLKAIENSSKRNELAEYIINQAAKDNRAMQFINMWKQQIPSIISNNFFGSMDDGEQVFNTLTNIATRNVSNPMLQKFTESDYQSKIIARDAKSLGTAALSSKLFLVAHADPEPVSKGCLYASAILLSGINWSQRGKDAQKIQNLQFLNATKELFKTGIVDPYEFINKISPGKIKLTGEKLQRYNEWEEQKLANLRYIKTGSTKDQSSDFNTEEGRNVLKKTIAAMKYMGDDDNRISNFLVTLGLIYLSVNETKEAQYLLELGIDTQKKLYGANNPKLIPALDILARTQVENEEFLKARETYKTALNIRQSNDMGTQQIINNQRALFLLDRNIRHSLDDKSESVDLDLKFSLSYDRISKLKDLKNKINELKPELDLELYSLSRSITDSLWLSNACNSPIEGQVAMLQEIAQYKIEQKKPVNDLKELIEIFNIKGQSTLPIELQMVSSGMKTNDLLPVLRNTYGVDSQAEITALSLLGENESNVVYLKKAFESSKRTNGDSHPQTAKLAYEIAMQTKNDSDVTTAIDIIEKMESLPEAKKYLDELKLIEIKNKMYNLSYKRPNVFEVLILRESSTEREAKMFAKYIYEINLLLKESNNTSAILDFLTNDFIEQKKPFKSEFRAYGAGPVVGGGYEEVPIKKEELCSQALKSLENNPGKFYLNLRIGLNYARQYPDAFFKNRLIEKLRQRAIDLENRSEVEPLK